MVRTKILRASAMVAASAGLMLNMVAVAGASAPSGSIDLTGFNSLNKLVSSNNFKASAELNVANHNNVAVGNFTAQSARSGNASASKNTSAGGVLSGDAMNHSATSTGVSVSNAAPVVPSMMGSLPVMPGNGAGNGSISTTGADSSNLILNKDTTKLSFKEVIANQNNIGVSNVTSQSAVSGNASSSKNTLGGNVISGNASNDSSTMTQVYVVNN